MNTGGDVVIHPGASESFAVRSASNRNGDGTPFAVDQQKNSTRAAVRAG